MTVDVPREPPWRRDLLALVLVLGFFFLLPAGWRALWSPDEGRYTEIPREMLASGDWLTPRLDGFLYFEKPPLVYWLEAGVIALAGVNEAAVRSVPALCALGACLAVYAAGRKLYGRRAGLLAAAVLATGPYFYALANVVTLDMPLTLFVSAAMLAFLIGVEESDGWRRRTLLLAFYGCAALAVMTKGLIGLVIPGMVIVPWWIATGEWRVSAAWRRLELGWGALLFLAIALPWHVAMAREHPQFLQFYIVHEHFARYTTTVHQRTEPAWYFLAIAGGGFLPWTALLPASLRGLRLRPRTAEERTLLFLAIWAFAVVAFFSASDSKLAPYVLPAIPPLALLVGRQLDRSPALRGRSWAALALIAFALALAIGGTSLAASPASKVGQAFESVGDWEWALVGALLVVALVPMAFRRRPVRALVALVLATVLFDLVLARMSPTLDGQRSVRPFARELAGRLTPTDVVVAYHFYPQDLPAYLGRRIAIATFQGELEFGMKAEPQPEWELSRDSFLERWRGAERIYVVATARDWPEIEHAEPMPRVLARTERFVLATNRE